ncbi:MAG: tRNA 4-thiouridine(8) synthase ThiI, partial [Defluviitaleaceae bacterium]|nr:tRNA 4-thiouridine(8) synthase ThiI [Defluviitaleaceae bacterium]
AREKVLDIARQLALAVGEIDLRVVNITNVQLRLAEACPPEKITILLKRAMLKMADKIAAAEGAPALITGDSIGQVASQTLRSLQATNSAAARPIIRPLSCMDKNEITAIAHKIGTYPISIRPYDDCCTLFLPKHPETKPKESIIISIENRIDDLPALMDAAIADSETYKF